MHLGFYFPELSFGEKEGSAKHQLQTLLITITEKCALSKDKRLLATSNSLYFANAELRFS